MWDTEQLKIKKRMFAKTKIRNFDSEAPPPHTKLLTLTGILWLK